jgi:hypothetical protein
MNFACGHAIPITSSSLLPASQDYVEAIGIVRQADYKGVDIWGARPHACRRDPGEPAVTAPRSLIGGSNQALPPSILDQFHFPARLCSSNESAPHDSVGCIGNSISTAVALVCRLDVGQGRALGEAPTDAVRRQAGVGTLFRVCLSDNLGERDHHLVLGEG